MYRRYIKRVCDLTLGSCLLIVLAPLLGITALLVRFGLGQPVLFRQQRAGQHGQVFTIFKFRTMLDTRDERGDLLTDEKRLTPLGTLLRKTSLDELPQLWNVVRGEMSLIGPRPLHARYLPRYNAHQARRHEVCPGITGWAQVNGRNALDWNLRLDLDVWYVDHLTFGLDVKILALTIWRVITREGISADNQATMSEFLGSAADTARSRDRLG